MHGPARTICDPIEEAIPDGRYAKQSNAAHLDVPFGGAFERE
jgi:hypothetical protein